MRDFILNVPAWKGEMQFTYEMVEFLLTWFLLAAGLLLCFLGYKYAQTLFLFLFGTFSGVFGIKIAEKMTQSMVMRMTFFVLFTFFGVCLLYWISIMLGYVLNRLKLRTFLAKRIYLVTAICGSVVTGGVVYFRIYHNIYVACGLFVTLAVMGTLYGKKKAAKRRVFRTYDDLYQMKPLEEGEQSA